MSNIASVCPQCRRPLPANSPAGLCPNCLMAMNMATQTQGEETPKPPPPFPEDIARFFPNYQILECLGRGGMGVVYLAIQKSLSRQVAIKILAPERKQDEAFARRFAKEAETLAKLSHPNIVTIHDFGQVDGMFYLVMEFVDGVTLRQLLQAGRIAPREALAIVPQICDGLQYAHDQGIVHRDIKPENIILDRRGRVKVADFGIAKILGEADAARSHGGGPQPAMTEAGKVVGTPDYMAPEQIDDPRSVDHRADIYALGVVFYQMLTGELPGERIEPPSKRVQVDVRLDEVVLRALEKDPNRRYSQASLLKTTVETITATPPLADPGSARPPVASVIPPPQKPAPHLSRTAILGAICFLLPISFATLAALILGIQGPSGFDSVARRLVFLGGLPFIPALFLQCILGWVAVAQIQKSEGRLYGLGLALFDGLLLPVLVLDAMITILGTRFRLGLGEGLLISVAIDALLLFWIVRHFAGAQQHRNSLKLSFAASLTVVLALTTLFFMFAPLLARNASRSARADSSSASQSAPAFTPLRDQVVRDLIDLDTGTLMPLPIPMTEPAGVDDPRRYAWFNEDKTAFAWMRARGIDAFQGNHGLIGVDMLAVEVTPHEFESLRPDELEPRIAQLGLREVPSSWIFNNVSGCYAFRTRLGGYGLLRLDPDAPEGVGVQWKMVATPTASGNHATWASLLTGSDAQRQESPAVAQQHAFTVEHNPKYGTEALNTCRAFVQEHQWKLMGESGRTSRSDGIQTVTVTMTATDGNGRKVTFQDEQSGRKAKLTIETEEGIELPAARIGVAICERLGWKPPVP